MADTSADDNVTTIDVRGSAATKTVGMLVTPTLPAPDVIGILPGPDGLIPTRLLFADLPVRLMTPWMFLPQDGESDWVTFIWWVQGSVAFELEPIELIGPITPGDFPIKVDIPQAYIQNNAVVDFSYRVNNIDKDSVPFETSLIKTITIDRAAPGGGGLLNAAKFLKDPITELDVVGSATVGIEVPGDYLDRKAGDTLLGYLSSSDTLPTRPANHEQIFTATTGPMLIQMPVAEIRKFAGSLILYFFYRVRDRAGNVSTQYSLVASTHLLINAPPSHLSIPEVPAYDSDLLVNREDARMLVSVRVRQYDNRLPGDQCVIEWDGFKLPAVPVSTLPLSVTVDWRILIANGADLRRIINRPVNYYILRDGDTVGPGVRSPVKRVTVDMTIAGQENPQAPALLNRQLALVNIHGAVSTIANQLDSRDANQPVRASFTLFDNPVPGERVLLFWPSRTTPVATYVVKRGDVGGATVNFDNPIDWQVIQDGGSNATTLVNYRTDNGVNQQLSPDRTVFVNLAPPVRYTRPSFPQSSQHPNGFINCATNKPSVFEGVQVLVNPTPARLVDGDVVVMSWRGFLNYPDRNPIPSTAETFSYIWGAADTTHVFLVAPYETLIRPLNDFSGGAESYSVFRNGILLGTSATGYVQIDRKYAGSGNYCGPNGSIGPKEK